MPRSLPQVAIVAVSAVGAVACPAQSPRGPVDCAPVEDDVDVLACQERLGPKHGRSVSAPLRWGRVDPKWPLEGRLVCASGREPRFEATAVSASGASSGIKAFAVHDCERAPFVVFVDESRCGELCPPASLSLISAAAARAYRDATRDVGSQALEAAAEKCTYAVAGAPNSEAILANCGAIFYTAKRYDAARLALDGALRLNPRDPVTRLHRAMVDLKEGRSAQYEEVLKELVATLPAGHALIPELKCKLAVVLRRLGERDTAERYAAEACRAGRKSCCHKPSRN